MGEFTSGKKKIIKRREDKLKGRSRNAETTKWETFLVSDPKGCLKGGH